MKLEQKPKNIVFDIYHKNKNLQQNIEDEIKKANSHIYGPESKLMKYIFILMILIQIILLFIYL